MQVTKKVTIAKALEGAAVDDSMPLGWLVTFVDRVNKQNPGANNGDIRVRGAAGIYAEWQHTLTPQEEVEARLQDLYTKAEQIKSLLPRKGEPLSADAVDRLRQILG